LDINYDSKTKFSKKAEDKIVSSIIQNTKSLIKVSIEHAEIDQSDFVSEKHVIITTSSQFQKGRKIWGGILGNLILGGCIANTISILIKGGQILPLGFIITVLFCIIGSFLSVKYN